MNKVYLLWASKGSWDDYVQWVERVFSNKIAAERYKEQLEKEIEDLKDGEYRRDCEIVSKELFDDTYEKSWENKISYEKKYPQVLINKVWIEEKTLY